jgi:hypothetical protein
MSREKLQDEIDEGVMFWGYEEAGALVGVMPIQQVQDVTLVRHAYVRTSSQRGRSGRARHDPAIGEQILAFLKPCAPRSTAMPRRPWPLILALGFRA